MKERGESEFFVFPFLRTLEKKKGKEKNFDSLTHAASARAASAHPLLDRVLAVLVVDAALLRVAQDVVGLVDVLEGVGVAAWRARYFFFVSVRGKIGEKKEP